MPAFLTQYLCPERHCIVAIAWHEQPDLNREQVERMIVEGMKEMGINPWCGLCGSTKLHFETASLPGSVDEMKPALEASEEEQALTRLFYPRPKNN